MFVFIFNVLYLIFDIIETGERTCVHVCVCVCVDIFMIERSQRREGIHLRRILPTLNYESTRYARLKIEWPIKERKCIVIEEV